MKIGREMKAWQHVGLMVLAAAFTGLALHQCERIAHSPALVPGNRAAAPKLVLATFGTSTKLHKTMMNNLGLLKRVQARVYVLEDELFQCQGTLRACVEGELMLMSQMEGCVH
jgi:hypothetical protein